MAKPVQIINDYWLKETLLNGNPNLEKFYKEDLIKMINILKLENKKYKETINKAKKWVKNRINHCTIEANSTTTDTMCRITIVGLNNLLDILKEVEHD